MDVLTRAASRPLRRALLGAALGLLAARAAPAAAPLETTVKSVYLFKFGDYVEWPVAAFSAPDSPFVIGVLGKDPLGTTLDDAVQGRTVSGRPIVVRRFDRLSQVHDVHVLYISPSRVEDRGAILAGLKGRGVLTVSEEEANAGAIVDFVRQETKVRFEIDADAAEQAGLKLRSELLSLAVNVKKSQ